MRSKLPRPRPSRKSFRSTRRKRAERPAPQSSPSSPLLPDYRAICAQAKRDGLFALPACLDLFVKHPCILWKGYQKRRPIKKEITGWIRQFPHRNGIYVTGRVLGRFTLDIDSPDAAKWAMKQGLPLTHGRFTGRGAQFDFAYPAEFEVKNSTSKIHPHVDIRGRGGIAVAVGSIHWTGRIYRWIDGLSPAEAPLAEAPPWLLDWLREEAERHHHHHRDDVPVIVRPFTGIVSPWASAVIERELAQLGAAEEGTRNDALARISFKFGQICAGGEADRDALIAAIYAIASQWSNPAKSRDTIIRCFNAGTENPRTAPSIFPSRE